MKKLLVLFAVIVIFLQSSPAQQVYFQLYAPNHARYAPLPPHFSHPYYSPRQPQKHYYKNYNKGYNKHYYKHNNKHHNRHPYKHHRGHRR